MLSEDRNFASNNTSKLMGNKINVAMVGAGYWGHKLLPKFLAAPEAVVRLVCDIHEGNRAAIRKRFADIPVTDSLDAILHNDTIDSVILVTPPATHYALAKRVLDAGKNVWIEKPLALRLDEGRELVQLASDKKAVLFVDHTFLYDPAVCMIREMILKAELGAIYHLHLQRLNLGRIKRDSNVWWNSAPHDASIVLYLLAGRPTGINLHGYHYLQPGLEDLNMAVIEMSDGTSAFIYHNWLYPENTAKLTVIGSKRLLVYEGKFEKRSITVYDYQVDTPSNRRGGDEELPTTIPSKIIAEHDLEGFQQQEPLAAAVADFVECVRDHRLPLSNGNFSLQVLAVLEAGERSLRANGARVPIEV
jgi:UDP-2-acetamido-3-amino-2,3-dideoxy-glucuronate N-acetyltransferase